MKHTKGPWRPNPCVEYAIISEDALTVARTRSFDGLEYDDPSNNEARANTERIVACVNALEGVADPSTIPVLIEAVRLLLLRLDDGHQYPADISVPIAGAQETFRRVSKPQDPTVSAMLDLSTAHVLRDEEDASAVDFKNIRFFAHAFGWTVFVSDYFNECPDWLRPIMEYASAIGAMIINFDSDAEVSDRFTLYEDV